MPEWRAALDALLSLPEIGGPVGYSGGVIAIGIRLAVVELRISAALLFAGRFVPRTTFEEAGRSPFRCRCCCSGTTKETTGNWPWTCSTPFGSREKTLHAKMGGHTGVPQCEGEAGYRFFARHLKRGRHVRPAADDSSDKGVPGTSVRVQDRFRSYVFHIPVTGRYSRERAAASLAGRRCQIVVQRVADFGVVGACGKEDTQQHSCFEAVKYAGGDEAPTLQVDLGAGTPVGGS